MTNPKTHVRILCDDWFLFGQIATVIDPEPVLGSSQMLVDVEGVKVTLSRHDVQAVDAQAGAD